MRCRSAKHALADFAWIARCADRQVELPVLVKRYRVGAWILLVNTRRVIIYLFHVRARLAFNPSTKGGKLFFCFVHPSFSQMNWSEAWWMVSSPPNSGNWRDGKAGSRMHLWNAWWKVTPTLTQWNVVAAVKKTYKAVGQCRRRLRYIFCTNPSPEPLITLFCSANKRWGTRLDMPLHRILRFRNWQYNSTSCREMIPCLIRFPRLLCRQKHALCPWCCENQFLHNQSMRTNSIPADEDQYNSAR